MASQYQIISCALCNQVKRSYDYLHKLLGTHQSIIHWMTQKKNKTVISIESGPIKGIVTIKLKGGPNPNTAKITPKKIKEREKSPWPWRLSASSKTPYSHPLTTPPTRSAALPLPSGLGSKPDYYDDTMAAAAAAAGVVETEDATVPENDVAGVAELDGGFNNSSTSSENFWGCPVAAERRKRRHPRVVKNKEEVESQRMTHIVVERNRRKQMNEYLSMLRSMMPPSYVHRGDQASIIGGAVNFVKELEQLLQSLKAVSQRGPRAVPDNLSSSPFADFFTFPQYSTDPTHPTRYGGLSADPMAAGCVAAAADVEVNMVDAHANVKVLSRRKPQQLLKMVVGLQSLGLTILHLNVTSVHDTALFSFSVKVSLHYITFLYPHQISLAVNHWSLEIMACFSTSKYMASYNYYKND
ncbi:hypothetical protein SAY87_009105 [Trapa incisa]|uniref:BHLH domain-containing protein n=1 Tax=Trapa incisa TaxID=236973 RepID=A0AAN7K169_9MYRT|nr:hypothetical protein SAY87_009105 [Trapa incisa]